MEIRFAMWLTNIHLVERLWCKSQSALAFVADSVRERPVSRAFWQKQISTLLFQLNDLHQNPCWLVSDGSADGGPVPDHTAAPSAILSCGRLLNNVPRATLRHRATKASTEDTNGPHKESVEARSAAI